MIVTIIEWYTGLCACSWFVTALLSALVTLTPEKLPKAPPTEFERTLDVLIKVNARQQRDAEARACEWVQK